MSSSSLRAARIYSIVILVLGYVGFSFVWGHQQRLATLTEARQAMARYIVTADAIESLARSVARDPESADPRAQSLIALGTNVAGLAALGEVEIDLVSEARDDLLRTVDVRVDRRGGGQWGVADLSVPAGVQSLRNDYEDSLADLFGAAAQVGIFESDDVDISELYVQIEQRTLGTEVFVPGVGLGFRGMQVVWVCVLATFGFLVILRDRVQHVLSDDGLAVDERWLVLDGDSGIEYALSILWLVLLIIAPIALSSGLVLGVTAQVAADGATSVLGTDLLMAAGVLILLTGNGWLSLNTASRIIELRSRRQAAAD